MCGRYALGVRMRFIRNRMQEQGLQVDDAPPDDSIRETYNFAPGYNGAIYRADSPNEEQHHRHQQLSNTNPSSPENEQEPRPVNDIPKSNSSNNASANPHYKLQSMKWGLIPSWTKRSPDYGSLMRTINCRDDSLVEDRGMWTSMKRKKRCVVICQGFYEWLKKGPGGKEKVPHFVKRKDGDLMFFAGLWDCVSFGDSEEPLFTYTIITTSSNPYLKFLHDRMPVILEPGSEAMKTWLDPTRTTWSKELQSVLKPYEGELECYAVSKEVGKVGNNSPDFMVPVASKENKNNIANFFANAKEKNEPASAEKPISTKEPKVEDDEREQRPTKDDEWSEDHAPKPVSAVKRGHDEQGPAEGEDMDDQKRLRLEEHTPSPQKARQLSPSPSKQQTVPSGRKTRSATHNQKTPRKTDSKKASDGSQRITKFFGK
ncbi:SOS response-associated peptidase [Aspergillus melleus]|uniref:SOS response-associated peptidase n=1 Tax=Aspergillus melleus TaxID=138277 RepID=UPI001E8ECFF3|nr:uncharacterized protein LDX57_012552 [Aspergillus melleus]KAH8434921.1 hypothetical protein LDX57_012552 [Aspergillus melleus]